MSSFLAQLIKFARVNKKLWIVPAVVVLVLIGAMIIVVQSSTIAPFLYALF